VLAFSDDDTATTYGAYSLTFNLPHRTRIVFLRQSSVRKAYLAVVDFFHMYASCGYDGWGTASARAPPEASAGIGRDLPV